MDVITLSQAKQHADLLSLGFADVTVQGTTVILTLQDGSIETITFPTPRDVSIIVNGTRYDPVNGVITLPDYPAGGTNGTQNFNRSDTKPTGNGNIGDIVFHSNPQPNGFIGWVYTSSGWAEFGMVGNNNQDTPSNAFVLSDGTQFLVVGDDGNGVPFLYGN